MATRNATSPANSAAQSSAALPGPTRIRKTPNTHPRSLALAVSAALLPWGTAYGLPTGESVVHGDVSVARPTAQSMEISQGTQKAIVNWQSFSIGASEHVNITQLNASSVLLNRVVGNDPSQIFGRLTANGQVFLVNTQGVFFSPSASVDVGSLFATSLSINDQDFLAGRYQFFNPGNAGSVVNQGNIVTANGYTGLAGPQVRNDGVIVARAGSVALAAGDRVSLDMIGDGLISVSVDQAALNASVMNTGRIEADGGTVLLAARSANALLDTVVNNSGIIRANSLVERNGEIVLDGGSAGVVVNSGTLQAAGLDIGTTGGTVKILGDKVGVFGKAEVDVSGESGGGAALIGGNFRGEGPEDNASQTIVGADAIIKADALNTGNGGKVVLWSDDATQFYGTISARGGAQNGNGGTVEVSGKQWLNYKGFTDARAPNGKTGTLLLDPDDLTIVHSTDGSQDNNEEPASAPNFVVDTADPNNPWTLTDFTINTALSGADVTVTTSTGSILISNASGTVVIDPGVANLSTLTMTSATSISWNAGWEYANDGQLTLESQGGSISGTGTVIINGSSPVLLQATTGISGTFNGVTSIAARTSAGDIALVAGSATGLAVDSLTNPVSTITVDGISSGAGNVSVTNAGLGALTLNEDVSGGNVTVIANDLNFATGSVVATGKATVAPNTAATVITLGNGGNNDQVDFGANAFQINGNITATSLQVGDASNTGGISVAGDFDPAGVGTTLKLVTSGTGAIDNAGAGNVIGGANVTSIAMVAGSGGIGATNPIETAVNSLAASATAGGIEISNDSVGGTLTVTAIDGVTGISSNGTAITIDEQDSLTVAAAIDAGAGTLAINFGQANAGATFTDQATGQLSGIAAVVTGGAGDDTFSMSDAPSTSATLDGDAGNDSLLGRNANSNWAINAANGGSVVAGGTLGFSDIENLTGGTADDAFVFNAAGTLAGSIAGGGGADTINIAALGGANTINLQAGTISGGQLGGTFTTVESFVGDGAADALVGTNANTTWTITGANGGTLSTGQSFTDIPNLTGGTADDTFTFQAAGSVTGTVDGGGSTTADTLNIAAKAGANTIDLQAFTVSGGFVGTIANLESFTGDNTADVLVGTNANTTWTITGANDGTLSTGFSFTDISTLTGGTLDDSFVFSAGASAGSINGGTGSNSINIAALAGANTIDLQAGTISTALTGTFTNVMSFTGDNAADVLVGTNANTTWTVTEANDGALSTGQSFTDIPNLTGGTLDDSFAFNAGSSAGSIDGGTGSNSINIAALAGANTIDLQAGTISTALTGTFTNVAAFTGDAVADVLVGTDANTTWTITGANDGTLSTGQGFTDIPNLTGGTADDAFVFNAAGTLAGSIVGSGGSDAINISAMGGGETVTLTNTGAGSIAGIVTSFTSVETFTGSGTDSLQLDNSANTATISGANSGSLGTGETFSGFNTLRAGTAGDTFAVTTGSMPTITGGAGSDTLSVAGGRVVTLTNTQTGSVNTTVTSSFTDIENYAGTGTDTLRLDNSANTATINTASAGSLGSGESFSGFGTLAAGTAGDSFVFTGTGSIASIMGNTGTDAINISAMGGGETVTLTNTNAGSIAGIVTTGFTGVETFAGSGADSLQLDNSANTASINTANAGNLGTGETFSGFNTLLAGTGGDSFVFTGTGSLSSITGNTGSDAIQNSTGASRSVVMSGASAGSIGSMVTTGFAGIDIYTGGGTDTLTAPGGTTINVTGANAGNVGGALGFTGVNSLIANAGGTTFAFNGPGSVATVTGGAGGDTLSGNTTYSITGANTGSATGVASFTGIDTLTGTGGNDSFTLQSGVATFNGTINGAAGTDTLAATDGANNWVITGVGSGTLNGTTSFTSIESIVGGTGVDTLSGTAPGATVNMTDPTSLTVGTLNTGAGVVNLTAVTLGGSGIVTAASGTFSSNTNVVGLGISIAGNLHMSGSATLYNYLVGSSAGSFSVDNNSISVQINGVTFIASIGQQQVQAVIGQVAEQIGAVIVDEANKTFGTDSVAEDVEYGFAGEIGATPPMDHRIDESGISVPRCLQEAREGVPCK